MISAGFVTYRRLSWDNALIHEQYFVRKLALAVFSTTDFPIIGLLILGIVSLAAAAVPTVAARTRTQPRLAANDSTSDKASQLYSVWQFPQWPRIMISVMVPSLSRRGPREGEICTEKSFRHVNSPQSTHMK